MLCVSFHIAIWFDKSENPLTYSQDTIFDLISKSVKYRLGLNQEQRYEHVLATHEAGFYFYLTTKVRWSHERN